MPNHISHEDLDALYDSPEQLINEMLHVLADPTLAYGNEGTPVPSPTSVYRVEMPSGRGPFNDDETAAKVPNLYGKLAKMCCSVLADKNHNHEQMGITEACFRRAHHHAAYGCASLADVTNWFPPTARTYLASLGAKIIHYQLPTGAPLYTVGQGEVIFSKADASVVETLNIETLEPANA